MKLEDTWISRGGLLRCCAETLLRIAENDMSKDFGDGAIVHCKLSRGNKNHRMMLLHGTWRWIDPESVELEEREKLRKGGLLWDAVRGKERA